MIGASLPVTFVDEFSSNVMMLSQQKNSRLAPYVSLENQKAEYSYFDRLAPVEMGEKVGRNSDTVLTDVDWSRRRVAMQDYAVATLVDQEDKLRLIHSPESEIMRAFAMGAGRKMDEIIIGSALGTAYAGRYGNSPVVLPDSQKIGATDGSTFSGLTTETLRLTKKKFWEQEAVGEDEQLYLTCTTDDLINMLRQEEAINGDYNTVRALVNGRIDDFMGFKFIRTELIPNTTAAINFNPANGEVGAVGGSILAGSHRCFAFSRDAIKLAVGRMPQGRVSERDDKNYAAQVYYRMTMGGVRMEEDRVVEILTKNL